MREHQDKNGSRVGNGKGVAHVEERSPLSARKPDKDQNGVRNGNGCVHVEERSPFSARKACDDTHQDQNGVLNGNGFVHVEEKTLLSAQTPDEDTPVHGEKQHDREKWGGKLDFIMASLSLSVGMGNMWRFPYLCYRNGGGAFLIPYIIVVTILGVPTILLEFILGQYGRAGIVGVWKVCPLFTGVGWGTFVVSTLGSIYYIVLVSWCFYYIFAAFASEVPWGKCDGWWNTDKCVSLVDMLKPSKCQSQGGYWANGSCLVATVNNGSTYSISFANNTLNVVNRSNGIPSSDEFFHRHMLGISDGIDDLGAPQWKLVLCLLVCWAIVFVCLSKGIKSSGKASYVTALFPYVILTALFVRGLLLEGSMEGLKYFFAPRWEMLSKPKVWVDAAIQAFFSLSIAWGGHITLASYNDFKNNFLRDSIIVVAGDTLTSIFGGAVIFSFIGYMAHVMSEPISQVATQGAGLAFIVYPEAVTTLPCPQLWAVLFMVTLINVGIGTEFGLVQTTFATVLEALPPSMRKRQTLVLFIVCLVMFTAGLPMTTRGGIYVLQLLDAFCCTYGLLIMSLVTAIALPWVYGTKNLIRDVEQMLNIRFNLVWVIWWRFVLPVLMTFLLGFSIFDYHGTTYGDYVLPWLYDMFGWMIVLIEFTCIPATAVYLICCNKSPSIGQKIKELCRSKPDWCPPPEYRTDNPENLATLPLNGHSKQTNGMADLNDNQNYA